MVSEGIDKMYKKRREILRNKVADFDIIILFAHFENHKIPFRQESSFYYFTGINEPGAVLCLYKDGSEELFLPAYSDKREQWVVQNTKDISIPTRPLGEPCTSYWMKPFFSEPQHKYLIERLREHDRICTILDTSNEDYFIPRYRCENVIKCAGGDIKEAHDISSAIAAMRRKKDEHELSLMCKAIDITCKAHERVAEFIKPGLYEYEVQAEIEKVFTSHGASVAFPSIVASGKNSTILHYMARDQKLTKQDMLVVDIGAEFGNYCADMTRTYSVGGSFSPRQKEVHQIVADTQAYIASIAKPGMFLSMKKDPERSLNHLAREYLKKLGYDKYFIHGIGHFLGLDVHDVADWRVPLEVGDVITIEPGVYIPNEDIGVRIEDDFLITATGCRVLGADGAE